MPPSELGSTMARVVVSDGSATRTVELTDVITVVGRSSEVQIPSDARVIDCTGKTIVAGFWNSHVHFTEAVWRSAANGPAAPLTTTSREHAPTRRRRRAGRFHLSAL